MPVFTSKSRLKSGVPLGGMGAGKLEIGTNGLLNAFSFLNNWSSPILGNEQYPGILGYHFGISAEPIDPHKKSQKKAFLLQTAPLSGYPIVKNITYKGSFARVTLVYEEPSLGLDVSLEAFSPWVPKDVKNSSLPCCFFTLRVKNRTKQPLNAGFLFIGRNVSGEWCIGRQNVIEDAKDLLHLEFLNTDISKRDVQAGSLRFSFEKKDWNTSFLESWNAVSKNFTFNADHISLLGWDYFAEKGFLPNAKANKVVQNENIELCGAVAAHQILKPGQTKELSFVSSWHFPNHPDGHRYQKWFPSASASGRYALKNKKPLHKKVEQVEEAVFSLPFPGWFNDALLTNLAPFFSSTWQVRDGRFAFYEAPVICPLMGTLDVGFYGSIPLAYFFPELEASQISQFANAQRVDGYIPHDLGRNRIDCASNGTTFHSWKDLNPKFILMVYRDFLWSGNKKFLKQMFPHVKKAIFWSLSQDHDGNCLPDNEGADQTFDLWEFYGTHPYTSSIFLAALLACVKMAKLLGDAAFEKQSQGVFSKGRRSFERELWNGKCFGKTSITAQLNGQWYASLLDLGFIADRAKIKKALSFTLDHNSSQSPFGMLNSIHMDGSVDRANDHSKNVWSGINYAFLSLCVLEDFPLNKLLKQARKLWDNIVCVQKDPWNQPDTIDAKTGRYVFGDSYYRNMAIWSIPIAYAKKDRKTASALKKLKSLQF